MWRLYLKDNEGVAIQSTKEKIFKAFYMTEEEVMPSKVRYIDYENDAFYHPTYQRRNLLKPFIHKRIEFKEENEFRLLHQIHEAGDSEAFWNNKTNHKGKFIPVDLNQLVDQIVLPPTCDRKTEEEIKSLTKYYGYNFKFRKSSLNLKPSFL